MQVRSLGQGRVSGGDHGNPLQYSCLENLMDKGVHGLQSTGSWTRLKCLLITPQCGSPRVPLVWCFLYHSSYLFSSLIQESCQVLFLQISSLPLLSCPSEILIIQLLAYLMSQKFPKLSSFSNIQKKFFFYSAWVISTTLSSRSLIPFFLFHLIYY